VIAVLLFAVALLNRDDGNPTAGDPSGQGSPSASDRSPSSSPSSGSSSGADQGPSEADMQAFVDDYLSTVTSDPRSAWKMLTPAFQRESGGYGSYSGFWGSIESATPGDVSADTDRMLVSYGVTYKKKNGSTVSDSVTLQLEQKGDRLLIAGES
jgi:hypothetical protein